MTRSSFEPLFKETIASSILCMKFETCRLMSEIETIETRRSGDCPRWLRRALSKDLADRRSELAEVGFSQMMNLISYEMSGASFHDLCQLLGVNTTRASQIVSEAPTLPEGMRLDYLALVYALQLETCSYQIDGAYNFLPVRAAIVAHLNEGEPFNPS